VIGIAGMLSKGGLCAVRPAHGNAFAHFRQVLAFDIKRRPAGEWRNREADMRTVIAGLWFASTFATATAVAQPAPFNEGGVTMGHWHLASRDVQANKKIFVGMGGTPVTGGPNEAVRFPGVLVNLGLGNMPGNGGTVGSVVNHVGFIVNNVQEQVAKWKAAGVPVLPGTNNRPDQAFVVTPDGVRMEILEDQTQAMPIRNEHVHFFLPEAEIAKAQAWYAKTFGGKAGTRNNAAVVDLPGVQLRFGYQPGDVRRVSLPQAPTKARALDHIGFDVKDLQAFITKIEAEGIKLDEPYRKNPTTGVAITYITDPWGTRIELVQRAPTS
jgi:catechol 2,3-dioxygenase-like lactoylglutathione lyase family enzyme